MTTTAFFLAQSFPQSVALDRIARWDEFTAPGEGWGALEDCILAERSKSRPRRKVLRALETALRFAGDPTHPSISK